MRLKNRVENLEEKLTIKIENLEKQLEKTQETLEFALKFGKDTITVWGACDIRFSIHHYIYTRYIKNGEVYQARKEIPYAINKESISVEKNPDGTYFIKGEGVKTTGESKCVYFQLIKDTGEIIDITEIKEHFENQEKITENLKESAEGLAKAISGLFSKKDTPKAEKVKKPRVKKTEKAEEPKQETKTEKKSNKKGDK